MDPAAESRKLCCSHCQGCHHLEAHAADQLHHGDAVGHGIDVGEQKKKKHKKTCPLLCLDYTCGLVWWLTVSVGVFLGGVCTCCYCCCGCCKMCRGTYDKPDFEQVIDPKKIGFQETEAKERDPFMKTEVQLSVPESRREKFNESFFNKARELKPRAPILLQPLPTEQFTKILDCEEAESSGERQENEERRRSDASNAIICPAVSSNEEAESLHKSPGATPGRESVELEHAANHGGEGPVSADPTPLHPSPPRSPANSVKAGYSLRLPEIDVADGDAQLDDKLTVRLRSRSTRSHTPASSLNLSVAGDAAVVSISRSLSDLGHHHQFSVQDLVGVHRSSRDLAGSAAGVDPAGSHDGFDRMNTSAFSYTVYLAQFQLTLVCVYSFPHVIT